MPHGIISNDDDGKGAGGIFAFDIQETQITPRLEAYTAWEMSS